MPTYRSEDGLWKPADKVTEAELKAEGIESRGMKSRKTTGPTASIHHTWEQGVKDQGVLAVETFPKVAKDKFDGIKIAPPTPDQKNLIAKNKETK